MALNTSVKRSNKPPRKIYLYQRANTEDLKAEAQKISEDFDRKNLSETNANDLWNEFKDRVQKSVEKNVPSKIVRNRSRSPWITQQIRRYHRKKQRAYNRAVKSNSTEDWKRFREIRKVVKKETRKSYRKFISEKCSESTKELYSFIKSLNNDNTSISALRNPETGNLVIDSQQKAEILSKQFQSQFTKENLDTLPSEPESDFPSMLDFEINEAGVIKLLAGLNPNKATGPDEISARYLKTTAEEIGLAVKTIFQLSLDTGVVPTDWLLSNITPIFKKGDRSLASNYRSVNLTSVTSKIFEHILKSNVMKHLDKYNILCANQHGFRRNHSCETQLINTIHEIASLVDQRHQVDMIIMDFAKAFDKVPHQRLLLKLARYGIRGKALKWTEAFLTQRKQCVVIDGKCSDWVDVESSVPQGTVTGPMDFLVFINDLPHNLTSSVKLFADDCIVFRKIAGPEDAGMLQKDLDALTAWQSKWQMNFNAQKCYVLGVTHSRSPHNFKYTLNNSELADMQEYPYLGVTITSNLTWNSHVNKVVAKANRTLGFIKRNLYSCSKNVKNMAYKTLVRPTMEYCGSVWDPSTKELTQKLRVSTEQGCSFRHRQL